MAKHPFIGPAALVAALVTAAALVAAGVGPAAASVRGLADAAAALGPVTGLTLDGHNPPLVEGAHDYDAAHVTATPGPTLALVGRSPTTTTTVAISEPAGSTLVVGHQRVVSSPDGSGSPVVDVTTPTGQGYWGSADLNVYEMARDATTHDITGIAATLWFEGPDGKFMSEIRWNATVPFLAFGEQAIGTPSSGHPTLTFTNTRATATTFGQAALGEGTVSAFTIVRDLCSGATLAPGAACTVELRAWPMTSAPIVAVLTLPEVGASARVASLSVLGRETAAGAYTAVPPSRILDTRDGLGVPSAGPLSSTAPLDLQVTGRGGVPARDVMAVVLNLTVTRPTLAGNVVAYPAGAPRPVASSINFPAGWTGANLVTVPVGAGGRITLANARGATHVVIDVQGFYRTDGASPTSPYASFAAIAPARVADTRAGQDGGSLKPGERRTFTIDSSHESASTLAVNVTVTGPTAAGNLSVGLPRAGVSPTSIVNFTRGATVTNHAYLPVSRRPMATVGLDLVNSSRGTVDVVLDELGLFEDTRVLEGDLGPHARFRALGGPERIADSRTGLGLGPLGPRATATVRPPASSLTWNTAALVTNVTAVLPSASTFLTVYRAGTPRPGTSSLNANRAVTVSTLATTPLGAAGLSLYNRSGSTNVLLDLQGTFERYPQEPDGVGGPGSDTFPGGVRGQ